jgi:hypothetical protein
MNLAASITDQVARHTGIAASRIHSTSKTAPVTRARFAIYYLLQIKGWSGSETSLHFHTSRRSICKGIARAKELIQSDPTFATII